MTSIRDAESIRSPGAGMLPNHLLAGLPDADLDRLAHELAFVRLRPRDYMQRAGEPLRQIYFPGRGVNAITTTTDEGGTIEIALVGPEGFIGTEAVLGGRFAICDALVQIEVDGAHVIGLQPFLRELERRGAFYDAIARYTRAFLAVLMQSVACNCLHSAQMRCCRWLLDASDRVGSTEFPLTHEGLAMLLAVRRPTVTLVMADLARSGAVSYARGNVRVLERPRLEAAACGCYQKIRGLLEGG